MSDQNNTPTSSPSATRLVMVTLLLFGLYKFVDSLNIHPYLNWLFLCLIGLGLFKVSLALFRDWQVSQLFKVAATPTGLYGSTEHVGLSHLLDAGLKTTNDDGNGIPIGALDKHLLLYHGVSHASLRAATGGGKTESSFVPICLALGPHRNILATGKGREPAELVAQHRENIGQDVIIVDIGNKMKGTSFKTHHFNFCGHLPTLADKNDPAVIDEARRIAQAQIAMGKNGGDNVFFTKQAQKWITWFLVGTAILQAETGELCCNLPHIYKQINSGDKQLKEFLHELAILDHFDGTISGQIQRILDKWERSDKTFESVLSELENGLEHFNPVSHIGQTSVHSDFDPHDIKRKPMTILLITDPTMPGVHGPIAGLAIDIITNLALKAESFEPRLTILADEFANLSSTKLPSIIPTLYTGRSLGVQLITYAQDTSTYARYDEEASAFTTQCEITLVSKGSSTKDAEEYSKRSGQISVMTESASLSSNMAERSANPFNVSISEKGIDRHRPDEFGQMPDYTAALFFKQLPAVMIDLVSYQQVMPWREQAGKVTNCGAQADLPVKFHL